jgi:8-amino-7-oxononanoate synthase
MSLNEKISEYTNQLEQQGLLRARKKSSEKDTSLVYFDTNDYLSLTEDARIAQAYQKGYATYPSGSCSSMVLSKGYHPNHYALEKAFSNLLSVDDCLLFSSGYAANLAITALLGHLKAHCIIDKGIHASVYDGLHLSQVSYTRFIHNDLHNLAKKLNKNPVNSIVITEGIFSMSGQISPLVEIATLCQAYQTELIVDEAHSFGVMGYQGRGAVDASQLSSKEIPLRIIPFGKALAAQGAIVAGNKEWIKALLQAGRSLIYSTALSPALSYGLLKTLDIVIAADERRQKLACLIQLFKSQIKASPLFWTPSDTPIQQLILGCPHKAVYFSKELKKRGFSCSAIRPPTVHIKAAGLRVVLNYAHTPDQILNFFEKLHLIYEY